MTNNAYVRRIARLQRMKKIAAYPSTPRDKACSRFAMYAAERTFLIADGSPIKILEVILSDNALPATNERFGHSASAGTAILASYARLEGEVTLGEMIPVEFDGFPVFIHGARISPIP